MPLGSNPPGGGWPPARAGTRAGPRATTSSRGRARTGRRRRCTVMPASTFPSPESATGPEARSVLEEAEELVPLQPVPSIEEGQLDQTGDAHDRPAEPFDQ